MRLPTEDLTVDDKLRDWRCLLRSFFFPLTEKDETERLAKAYINLPRDLQTGEWVEKRGALRARQIPMSVVSWMQNV